MISVNGSARLHHFNINNSRNSRNMIWNWNEGAVAMEGQKSEEQYKERLYGRWGANAIFGSVGVGFVCAVGLAVAGAFVSLGMAPLLGLTLVCCCLASAGLAFLDAAAA